MDFSFAKISEEFVQAICSTLMHSLWQGLLLAAFAGISIIFTRKSSAEVRYRLLIAGLIAFCCTITFTLLNELSKEKVLKAAQVNAQQLKSSIAASLSFNPVAKNHMLLDYLSNHSNTIVLIWFLIVLARTIQLLTGFHGLYTVRKSALFTVPTDLQDKLAMLASKMGIKQLVSVAESTLVKVPLVIGHIKPLILIPVGLLTALPPSAIEAILLHELAHISRRDYLVNLFISFIEVIFFFNPAVLWLVVLIREEREHCCDDMVVTQTSNKAGYIQALIICQEYNFKNTGLAMQLNGHKNHLLGRVKRILSKNNQSLNVIEKSLLSISLIIAGLLMVAFSNAGKLNNMVNQISHQVMQTGKEMVAKIDQKETSVTASSHPTQISTTNTISYQRTSDQAETHNSVFIIDADDQPYLFKPDGGLSRSSLKDQQVASMQIDKQTVLQNEYQEYLTKTDSLQQKKNKLATLGSLKGSPNYVVKSDYYRADSARKYRPRQEEYHSHKTGYETQWPIASPAIPATPELPEPGPLPVSMKIPSTTDLSAQLIGAMLNDSLASQVKSFKLSATELIINGKRVSDLAYQSFKNKNIQSIQKGSAVYYNFDTSTIVN